MQIAPSCYRHHAAQRRNPALRCNRAKRDDEVITEVQRVWHANMQVYGADKVWKQLNREGIGIARCTVERLMKRLGLQGVRRGRVVRTTVPDASAPCPLDRVNRQFKAERPNQLWVSDFTYVSTWQGWLYVAFVIDVYARRIVGWRVSSAMRTDFVLDALEQALYDRQPQNSDALVHHSDRGSQYVSIRYTERLSEAGIEPSVGSRGDSYDNALAETINGLYKTELSTAGLLGRPGSLWNWPHCNGCTGSTTSDCLSRSGISLQQKLRQTIGGKSPIIRPLKWPDLNQLASSKPGAIHENNWIEADVRLEVRPDGHVMGTAVERQAGDHEVDARGLAISRSRKSMAEVVRTILTQHGERGTGKLETTDPYELSRAHELRSEFTLQPLSNIPGPGGWRIPRGLTTSLLARIASEVLPEKRSTMFICASGKVTERYTIAFPKSMVFRAIPPDVAVDGRFISYHARYRREGDSMKVERVFTKRYGAPPCGPEEWQERWQINEVIQKDLRAQFVYD